MKRVPIKRIDKDTIHVMCPECRGAGSILKRSGGNTTHVLCELCDGKGGMNVPEKVLNMFIKRG